MKNSVSEVTIYHNPACGTSRNTLALLQEAGIEPTVIEYLKTPPSRQELRQLMADAGLTADELIRKKEALFAQLGLDQPGVSQEQMLDAMAAHPVLMNRPIVVTGKGTRLCRPAETVKEIL